MTIKLNTQTTITEALAKEKAVSVINAHLTMAHRVLTSSRDGILATINDNPNGLSAEQVLGEFGDAAGTFQELLEAVELVLKKVELN